MVLSLLLAVLASNPYLDEGRRHFANLEFDAAVKALAIAVEQPGLSSLERREAFDTYAQSLLAVERRDDAIAVYKRLLSADPLTPTPKAAPKVVESFLVAKRAVFPPPAVTLEALQAGEAVNVSVFDPWQAVKRVRWLELTESLTEGQPVAIVEGRFVLTPSPAAKKVLIDALGANDVLLVHRELVLVAPSVTSTAPTASMSLGALTITGLIAAGVSAAAAITFFGLGWQAPPSSFADAASINTWNGQRRAEATAAWSFTALAAVAGVFSALSLAF